VLLIHKKRGLGAGKINGPGGKIEPGETPVQAAVREAEEELRITPVDVEEMGTLRFQFVDGLAIHCVVFIKDDVVVSGEANAITGQIVRADVRLLTDEPRADFRRRMTAFLSERLAAYKIPQRVTLTKEPLHNARFKKTRSK
jgi:mutator protein MutT